MNTGAPVVLQAHQLSWQTKDLRIVEQVNLVVHAGETLGLVGPNGSGKSTLLRLLSGVLTPSSGRVELDGMNMHNLPRRTIAQRMAVVAQLADTQDAIPVWEAVALGRTPWLSALEPLSDHDERIVAQALHAVGLQHRTASAWRTLSGGERQRVHIARALAQQPQVLLLDEPGNHLDIQHQLSLMQLLATLHVTQVIALHDLNQAMGCDQLAVMNRGRLVCVGKPAEVLTPDLVREVFGVQMRTLIDPWDGQPVLRFTPL